MLILNSILYTLGINTNDLDLLLYVYVRICLLPYMIYINYIAISNIMNLYSKDKIKIDYSIFSKNIFESLTLGRLLCMITCISFIFIGKSYINYGSYINKNYLITLKNVDKKNISFIYSCNLFTTPLYHSNSIFNKLNEVFNLYLTEVNKNNGNVVSNTSKVIRSLLTKIYYTIIGNNNNVYVKNAFQKFNFPKVIYLSDLPLYLKEPSFSTVINNQKLITYKSYDLV